MPSVDDTWKDGNLGDTSGWGKPGLIEAVNSIIGNKYVNMLSASDFQGFTTVGGFPYSRDYGSEEKQVNMSQMSSTSARLQITFTAKANRKYLLMVSVRIATPNPTSGQVGLDLITGGGTWLHPKSVLNVDDTNGYGLFRSPSYGSVSAPLTNSYCHAAGIYSHTTNETVKLQFALNDSTKTLVYAYKELMLVDITSIYTQAGLQSLVNYGYFQTNVPDTTSTTDIKSLASRVTSLEVSSRSYDPLWGKLLATAGDSITEGVAIAADPTTGIKMTYGGTVATNHNMTFYNYGVSGSTLSNVAGKNPFVDPARYQNMAPNLDYLTIFFGWNDNAYGTLGTITDTIDTTYFGAWNTVLPWLITNYPKTKIGLIVPYGCTPAMRQAVRDIAKKYGFKCLDLYSDDVPMFYDREASSGVDSAVRTARQTSFLADGVHPNADGYAYLATIFENFLRSL